MRLVVLTCLRRGSASLCLPELAASEVLEVVMVVYANRSRPRFARRVRRTIRKVFRIGPLGALNGIRMRNWYRSDQEDIEEVCARLGVPFRSVPSLNSAETEALFRAADAELGLSLGNSYISPRIFEIPAKGMINLHGELLPDYRGAQSVIWPIHEGRQETGFSIHQVDATIDGGSILFQLRQPIQFHATLRETVARGGPRDTEVAAAVRHVCEKYDELAASASPQTSGRSFTTPTLGQYLRMVRNHRRLYRRSMDGDPLE